MAFTILEAELTDHPALARVFVDCHVDDDIWKHLAGSLTHEEQVAFITERRIRGEIWYRKFFKAVDEDGKIVAYAGLTLPHHPPSKEEEAKGGAESPPPSGLNMGLFNEFRKILSCADKYGYDPALHFHRAGTFVHPSYQRRGIGTLLSRHCDALADAEGKKTFVVARPNSFRLMAQSGFVVLGSENLDMTKYGGGVEDGKSWILEREAR